MTYFLYKDTFQGYKYWDKHLCTRNVINTESLQSVCIKTPVSFLLKHIRSTCTISNILVLRAASLAF